MFHRCQVVFALLVVLDPGIVDVELAVADRLEELSLDDPPTLESSRLEIENDVARLTGGGRCRTRHDAKGRDPDANCDTIGEIHDQPVDARTK